jgi:hypothetical protein
MNIANAKTLAAKFFTLGLMAGAVALASPAKAQAQVSVGIRLGQPWHGGYVRRGPVYVAPAPAYGYYDANVYGANYYGRGYGDGDRRFDNDRYERRDFDRDDHDRYERRDFDRDDHDRYERRDFDRREEHDRSDRHEDFRGR